MEITTLVYECKDFWFLHCNEFHARLQEMWLLRDDTIEDLSLFPTKNIKHIIHLKDFLLEGGKCLR